MNYKKILKNQKIRFAILKLLDFLPDKMMIKIQYRFSFGRKLNLTDPKRFTEKIQWYKLYYRNSLMITCSDKYAVRDYVYRKGLGNCLIPLYNVYSNINEIDFTDLPMTFVLKTTNGSHTNIICKDKNSLDKTKTLVTLNNWMKTWNTKLGREWAYHMIKPKIICEKYMIDDENNSLIDYKFFCFNGEPFYLYVVTDRFSETGPQLGIFDLNFNQLSYGRADIPRLSKIINKPENFEEMISISKILSKDFPHVRVDLYNIAGKVYFGELTFYNASGYKGYIPDEFDYIVGDKFTLPKRY